MVPSSPSTRPLVHWRTVHRKGLSVNSAYRAETIIPSLPRWGQRLPDHQVALSALSSLNYLVFLKQSTLPETSLCI